MPNNSLFSSCIVGGLSICAMDSITQVKEIIKQIHISSNGKCGISIPNICYKSNLSLFEVNKILKQLYAENFICLKKGINGHLIFKTETI